MPWELNGNAGIGPQDFLGTRNNAPLIIRTNTNNAPANLEEVMRVTPSSATARGNVGIGTLAPLYRLHVTALGGFGAEDANGVSQPGNVPIVAQSDSTAIGVMNSNGRPAFALNIDGNGGTSSARGVPTLYDRFDGNWHPALALRNGNVEVAGSLAVNGLSTARNAQGDTTGPGFPSWSGGGINAFDVFARGALYAGTNIESPQVQIYANGTVSASVKAFKIAHPLDPDRRYLIHACLEGPENAIYYRGQAKLEEGRAHIELPEYFEALARPEDRTVAITPCCQENELISILAASTVVNGSFNVRAADDRNPRQSFYWEVKAVRADVEPLEVEEHKGRRKGYEVSSEWCGSANGHHTDLLRT